MKKRGFIRRRWLDFRQGHGQYFSFALNFTQFVIVTYTMYFNEWITELWQFGVLFCLTYIPGAIVVGYWHNKTQQHVDIKIRMKHVVDEIRESEKRIIEELKNDNHIDGDRRER